MTSSSTVIEVFADVACPFTHVGLRRFVDARSARHRDDVELRVRAWPLEVVNGAPLDPQFIAEEIDEIRGQVAPSVFAGFDPDRFPASSFPALALADSAYRVSPALGEAMSLALRDELFEHGQDIADADVLDRLASRFGVSRPRDERAPVLADHAEGLRRGVIGSPHFFTPAGGYFCPALDVGRDSRGHLRISADPEGFDAFLADCFA